MQDLGHAFNDGVLDRMGRVNQVEPLAIILVMQQKNYKLVLVILKECPFPQARTQLNSQIGVGEGGVGKPRHVWH